MNSRARYRYKFGSLHQLAEQVDLVCHGLQSASPEIPVRQIDARHGGGAFSGKDPTKVDRSAAYYARYIAKNIVAAKLAKKCEIQLAYAIGVAKPVSIMVDSFGTSEYDDDKLAKAVEKVFDCRPNSIIEQLKLKETKYQPLAAYGHMGREELGVRWEEIGRASCRERV